MNHIQIITHLTKNAPNHTRITTPTFLVIGILSLITGVTTATIFYQKIQHQAPTGLEDYTTEKYLWITTIALAFLAYLFTAKRHIKKQNSPIENAGLKLTITSALPIILTGAIIAWSISHNYPRGGQGLPFSASALITFYAIALLSLRLFLPTSARILATILLAFGITTWLISWQLRLNEISQPQLANFYLIFTGLLHIITATGALLFEKTNR